MRISVVTTVKQNGETSMVPALEELMVLVRQYQILQIYIYTYVQNRYLNKYGNTQTLKVRPGGSVG